jgi:molecular chaperone DnaJ
MTEDLYHVLGVERDATPEEIREAYRRKAKRYHPDASGNENSSGRFREVEEAYETLRDGHRRRAYDRKLARGEGPGGDAGQAEPVISRPSGWEPRRSSVVTDWGLRGLSALFEPFRFSMGRGSPVEASPSPSPEPLLEVLLSPEEASRGASVAVDVPLIRPCPRCGGLWLWDRLSCESCAGKGWVRSTRQVRLEIPPRVSNGSEFRCDAAAAGSEVPAFRVRVLVGPA